MRRRTRVLAIASLLTITAAACSSGGGGNKSASGRGSCAARAHLTGSVNDTGTRAAAGNTIRLEMQDSKFSPTCTTSVPAGTITVTVHNGGSLLHNFSVPDQSIDHDVQPGQTITVQVKVGTTPVTYFCKYHRFSGMAGALLPTS
jgi:plastocyanin